MIYVFLADGFEMVEALAPIDIMRRAGLDVRTVGVFGKEVTSSHKVSFLADMTIDKLVLDDSVEAVILPGGMPGTRHLDACDKVWKAVSFAHDNGKLVGAICAAPSVLGHMGLLKGKKATCYPGFEEELDGASYTGEKVTVDGDIITAKGAGAALEFGFAIVEKLISKSVAEKVADSMMF